MRAGIQIRCFIVLIFRAHISTMPTIPYFTALFAAGTDLWSYAKWQDRTHSIVPPFSSEATPSLTGLSEHEISAIKALSDRIHSISSYTELIVALGKDRDNDGDGRRAWNTWAKKHFTSWGIIKDIEKILTDEGRHPRQLIRQQGFVSEMIISAFAMS